MQRRMFLAAAGGAAMLAAMPVRAAQAGGRIVLTSLRRPGEDRNKAPSAVMLEGDRIAAIGAVGSLDLPADARVMDYGGRWVLPGLVSAHNHVGSQTYTREAILAQLAQFQRYGVTTITAMGMNKALFYPLRAEIRAGRVRGADMVGADRGIGVPRGAPPADAAADQLYRPATPGAARAAVREMHARGTDLVKIWVDDFQGARLAKMAPEVQQAVIDEAHAAGLRVVAHVYYLEDARALVQAGADILGHGVRDKAVDDAFVALLRERGTVYIPTLGLDEAFYIFAEQPELRETPLLANALTAALKAQFADPAWRAKTLSSPALAGWKAALATNKANVGRLHRNGVRLAFGTDSGAMPLRVPGWAEHRELALLVESGLTPTEALALATERTAHALRLDDRGVLAAGKRADLAIVDADPAQDIAAASRIAAVWQAGRWVSAGPLKTS